MKSKITNRQAFAALIWLPVHLFLLPWLFFRAIDAGYIDEAGANFLIYAIGAVFFLIVEFRFLRQEFEPLADSPGFVLRQVLICYAAVLGMNMCVSGIVSVIEYLASGDTINNLNNNAVVEMASVQTGPITAMAVFLAPIVEEIIFRGGMFCTLFRRNRIAAYLVSIAAFSLYHVWNYAMADPGYWIYLIQYIPASFMLCRCYERTGTIWSSIFLHMLINGVSLSILGELA